MNAWLAVVIVYTNRYRTYKQAVHLPDAIRGFEMHLAKAKWELAAAAYRVGRRKEQRTYG